MAATALVTGASRGIGKASALALAGAGFDVAVAARTLKEGDGRDEADTGAGLPIPGSLEATATEILALGRRALPVPLDLRDRASLTDTVDTRLSHLGRIRVLVNNAVHTATRSI